MIYEDIWGNKSSYKARKFYMSLLEDKLICELIQQVLLNCW